MAKSTKIPKDACIGFILGFGYVEDWRLGQLIIVHEDGYFPSVEEASKDLAKVLWDQYIETIKVTNLWNANEACQTCHPPEVPTRDGFEDFMYSVQSGTNDSTGNFLWHGGWGNGYESLEDFGRLIQMGLIHEVPENAERYFQAFIPELKESGDDD